MILRSNRMEKVHSDIRGPLYEEALRMQAAGYTAREIADQLHITQRTVKYHASENYRKLDAKNLVDAVQIAQALHIL